MNGRSIFNVAAGVEPDDIVIKSQLDAKADASVVYSKTESDTRYGGVIMNRNTPLDMNL